MKNSPLFIALLAVAIFFCNCSDQQDTIPSVKTKVRFSISNSGDIHGRKQSSSLSGVRKIAVSIKSITGEEILFHHLINVTSIGSEFISEPIEFDPGHYILTDFFLLNDSSRVIFAAPRLGSFLGALPKQPLNRGFSVLVGSVNSMSVEVLSTEDSTPESFGYTTFSILALETFPVAVKILKDSKTVYTTAEGYILHGTDTVAKAKLGPSPTLMKFHNETNEEYELVIIKDGYARFNKRFKFNELVVERNHKPLLVNLVPAMTMRLAGMFQFGRNNQALFTFKVGNRTTFTINWGDGTIDNSTSVSEDPENPEEEVSFEHVYATDTANYFVSVTGDLSQVVNFQNYFEDNYAVQSLTLDALKNLESVELTLYGVTGILNLSKNLNLKSVTLNSDGVILPKTHYLSYVRIPTGQESYLDYIIKNVYANTKVHETKNGVIDFSSNWYGYDPENPSDPIKIPSSYSKFLLRELHDKYQWTVYPPLDKY